MSVFEVGLSAKATNLRDYVLAPRVKIRKNLKMQLPRPTAHRLLETLEELGYIRRTPSDNRFLVTIKARPLMAATILICK